MRMPIVVMFLSALAVVVAACGGGGVSIEDLEAVQRDLKAQKQQVADLQNQLAKAEATPAALVADLQKRLANLEATPEPLAVVESNVAARNAGDIRSALATYADDIVLSSGPGPGGQFESVTGLAEVLEGDLESIRNNQQITLTNTSVDGNIVKGEYSLTDDESSRLGLSVNGTFEAVVEAGKIKSLATTLGEETQAQLQELFGPPPGPPPQPNEVIITAFDTEQGYGFTGPDSLPAGWTPMRLISESRGIHHLQLIKLPEGKALEELFTALAGQGPAPAGVKFLGGPGTVVPGGVGLATVNLEPGSYVMVCLIPDEDGVPHFVKGMVKPLIVTAATGPSAAEPQAVATVDVSDSGFTLAGTISAGVQIIRVTNSGRLPHESNLLQIAPGASAQVFLAAISGPGAGGPVPGRPLGGVQAIDPGAQTYFTAVFEPGSYAFLDFRFATGIDFTVQ